MRESIIDLYLRWAMLFQENVVEANCMQIWPTPWAADPLPWAHTQHMPLIFVFRYQGIQGAGQASLWSFDHHSTLFQSSISFLSILGIYFIIIRLLTARFLPRIARFQGIRIPLNSRWPLGGSPRRAQCANSGVHYVEPQTVSSEGFHTTPATSPPDRPRHHLLWRWWYRMILGGEWFRMILDGLSLKCITIHPGASRERKGSE